MKPPLVDEKNRLHRWQSELLDAKFASEKAREIGLIRRMRKFNPAYLLYILTFGISCHTKPSFEEIYRNYIDFDDTTYKDGKIRIQSFVKRFNECMVAFLLSMLNHHIEITLSECHARLKKPINILKDILIQDSTIIRLSKKLSTELPAARYRGEAGGVKIHAVYSAVAHSLKSFQITGERVHDSKMMKIDDDVNEKLFIFDLGYYLDMERFRLPWKSVS